MTAKDKYRAAYRRWHKSYYTRHNYHARGIRKLDPRTPRQNREILLHEIPDVELARRMKTSVRAIQCSRTRLKRLVREALERQPCIEAIGETADYLVNLTGFTEEELVEKIPNGFFRKVSYA